MGIDRTVESILRVATVPTNSRGARGRGREAQLAQCGGRGISADPPVPARGAGARRRRSGEFFSAELTSQGLGRRAAQVRDDTPESSTFYRHISKGAWPFSSRDHGWPISDCSSEGLKAALTLARMDPSKVTAPPPSLSDSSFPGRKQ